MLQSGIEQDAARKSTLGGQGDSSVLLDFRIVVKRETTGQVLKDWYTVSWNQLSSRPFLGLMTHQTWTGQAGDSSVTTLSISPTYDLNSVHVEL